MSIAVVLEICQIQPWTLIC